MFDKPNVENITGRIKFVEHFADYKVAIVDTKPDLLVKIVDNATKNPSEWQIVANAPDIKIQIVENFPDFTIQFVEKLQNNDTKGFSFSIDF